VDASLTTVRKQNKDVKCSALLGLDEADGAGDVLKVVGVHPLDGDVAALGLSDGVVPTYCVQARECFAVYNALPLLVAKATAASFDLKRRVRSMAWSGSALQRERVRQKKKKQGRATYEEAQPMVGFSQRPSVSKAIFLH